MQDIEEKIKNLNAVKIEAKERTKRTANRFPFECWVCDCRFKTEEQLIEHEMVHSKEP